MKFLPLEMLTGKKFALIKNDVAYVSPAVYNLIIHAENDKELTHILKYVDNIEIKLLSDIMEESEDHDQKTI
jgi:hypothetical protein